jgi:bifunctional UDP-N-acetylglucosamine pyrophosphorylase / glucosamine-1-phosphate N-acetyltransferase
MINQHSIASIVMAAGRGSRMKGLNGSKSLLPLKPKSSPFQGDRPMILNILENLPDGPKAIVVNFDKQSVIDTTKAFNTIYCEQKELNGTGGALLSCQDFLAQIDSDKVIITMGDVPLVKPSTYRSLIDKLDTHQMVVLGFCPKEKGDYGVLEIQNGGVTKIIESKYWKTFPSQVQEVLKVCNSGIYAVRRRVLFKYLSILAKHPHVVRKNVENQSIEFNEYFVTDLIELMSNDGKPIGYKIAEDERELIGVDDIDALKLAQTVFHELSIPIFTGTNFSSHHRIQNHWM